MLVCLVIEKQSCTKRAMIKKTLLFVNLTNQVEQVSSFTHGLHTMTFWGLFVQVKPMCDKLDVSGLSDIQQACFLNLIFHFFGRTSWKAAICMKIEVKIINLLMLGNNQLL